MGKGEYPMYQERIGLAVWLHSPKQARHLRKFGIVHYVSNHMNYAILYCSYQESDSIVEKLEALPFVNKVEKSQKPSLETTYSGPLHPRESQERKAIQAQAGI